VKKIIRNIEDWFSREGGGGLILPDGWFGRPHDNFHQLTSISDSNSLIEIVLDDILQLKFEGNIEIHESSGNLIISNFKKLDFQWQEYGADKVHNSIYEDGKVEFVNI